MSLLTFKNINKSFSKVQVLHDISFSIEKGKLIALMGENGAGKSTLMKILCGVINDYEGTILLNGEKVKFDTPREAENAGIAIIHQELNLVTDLSVSENIFLGKEPKTTFGFVDFKKMNSEAELLLSEFNFPFSVDTKIMDLPIGWQQMVEIAKALRVKAEIIVMDEPTSALSESEITFLFQQITLLKAKGKTIIYISHRMKEIFELSDEVAIMRDGHYIDSNPTSEVSHNLLVSKMAGKEIIVSQRNTEVNRNDSILSLNNVSVSQNKKTILSNLSFDLKAGEVIGVGGLLGSGRTELLKFLYGAFKSSSNGEVHFKNKPYIPDSPSKSIKNKIVFLSEDRKSQGIFPELSNLKNSSISILEKLSSVGFLKRTEERETVSAIAKDLKVKMDSVRQPIKNLSGGNQQKVLLSRVLLIKPDLLLLDEPTRGIDVGAKQEFYNLIHRFRQEGMCILLTSSEIPELLLVSDRILVLSQGKQKALLETAKSNSKEILNYAFKDSE